MRSGEDLQAAARRHLWMQFAHMEDYGDGHPIPLLTHGEGPYVFDDSGARYLDGLSGLFCSNAGHGRTEIAEAMSAQASRLAYANVWTYAHPPAIELAERIASLTPGDLDHVFFTSGGGEAVESALKLARQYHRLRGNGQKYKVIARETAYHGTTLGALSVTGLTAIRAPFEPLAPGGCHVPNTNDYRWPDGRDPLWAAEAIAERVAFEGSETVAAVILEPVQSSGGCLTPQDGYFQRVREICDENDLLLISDETICAWGRLGSWFGCAHYDYMPDVLTTAKALTSAYAPMGVMIATDRIFETFREDGRSFTHGFTFSGHPVAAAAAHAALDIYEREGLVEKVAREAPSLRGALDGLTDLPIVGDIRGEGYFYAIELVADRATKRPLDEAQTARIMHGQLAGDVLSRGLICRVDDRGDPVLQLAPPLVCGPEQIEEIVSALRPALTTATEDLLPEPGHG